MTEPGRATGPVEVLVGGVSELFQHDLDIGRLAVERLRVQDFGAGVAVEELHYGAIAVAQRLQDVTPRTLILVSAVERGRPAGTVERRRLEPPQLDDATVQLAVGDAVTGYVHPDLVVEIAAALGCLPARTIAIEVEPALTGGGEGLSPLGTAGLEQAIALIRLEIGRVPLLALAEQLQPLLEGDRLDGSTAPGVVRELLVELTGLERDGAWGRTFALRDRLRLAIAGEHSAEGMDHRDWALWWALVEELDRLEALEAAPDAPAGPRRLA